jgi:hypothetical protein
MAEILLSASVADLLSLKKSCHITIALLQPHPAIQDPDFLTKIKISHDYGERFYKNW